MITRRAYSYRRKSSPVKSRAIKNRGLPGKGPYTLPPLSPGKLYGYTVAAPVSSRRKSLSVAMRKNSPLTVFRRLEVLARYLKRTSPTATRTILSNASWVRRKY